MNCMRIINRPYNKSYSQQGEDMLVDSLFHMMGIELPSYIDVGANDPLKISNTAFFYKKGCRGINIEPNPVLYKKIKRHRLRDVNINAGVGEKEGKLDFYIMNANTMSTFSKESADQLVNDFGFKIKEIIIVPVLTLSGIIDKYCNGVFPDFLTIDTEGLDYTILKGIDYERNYPKVICAETREYGEGLEAGKHETEIEDLLLSNGYRIYANTFINTIFYKLDKK